MPAIRLDRYLIDDQWQVLVGKSDTDNDRLSLKIARADDWWFHVRGMPGSHVVLQVPPGQEPERSVLKQAASIAAYHSKARKGGLVAVSGTKARYVRKPRDAKPGTVQIRKEVVFKVRPNPGERASGPDSRQDERNAAESAERGDL